MPQLHWLTRDEDMRAADRVPYRLLDEVPEEGFGEGEASGLLVQGDNLDALKALLPFYAGRVRCIYIDPPYNTGSAFEHYEDNLEHARWLGMMVPRLKLLREFLSEDGQIWIQIDDKEGAYLRAICDEIMGRRNFINAICVKTSDPSGHKTINPSPYSQTEYIFLYSKERSQYRYEQRYVESDYDTGYNQVVLNPSDHHTEWFWQNINGHVAQRLGFADTRTANAQYGRRRFSQEVAQFALENADRVFQLVAIADDAGRDVVGLREKTKRIPDTAMCLTRESGETYAANGRQIYFYRSKLRLIGNESVPAKPLTNLWSDIPWNGTAREGGVTL